MSIENYLDAMGGVQNLVNPFAAIQAGQQAAQQDQQSANVLQGQQAALAQQAAAQQAAQQQQADVQAALANPTAASFAALQAKYPKDAAAYKEAWATRDKDAQQADLTSLGGIVGAINSGKPDLALQALQTRADANAAAGVQQPDVVNMLEAAKAGDWNAVKGLASYHIAAIAGPDKLNDLSTPKTREPKIVGKYLVGDDGKPLFHDDSSDDEKPKYITTKDADGNPIIVKVGGGATAGGDAPDPTGIGSGSVRSIRNKNPGNLVASSWTQKQPGYQGTDGKFAIFDTPENGAAAQAALLSNYIDGGANTVGKIISKWAPSSDGNNTGQYVRTVAAALGVNPAQPITKAMIPKLQAAIAHVEAGSGASAGVSEAHAGDGAMPGAQVVWSAKPQGGSAGTPGASDLVHGDDYLKTLPANLASQVKALSEGRLELPSSFALTKPYWQTLLQQTAQYDPSFDVANAKTRISTRKDFTSGKSAQAITSFNTAIGHLDTLSHAADDLDNTRFTPWNSLANGVSSTFGDPRVKAFNAAKIALTGELAKAFKGGVGTQGEVEDLAKQLDASGSPKQIHGVIDQFAHLLMSKVGALGDQYSAGMGRTIDGVNLLNSKARATLANFGIAPPANTIGTKATAGQPTSPATPAPAAPSAPVRVSTRAQMLALPPGTPVILPDGRQVVRK